MKKFFTIIIFQLLIYSSFSQNFEINGMIKDSSGNPIEYASVGILNKPIGTVSNLDGNFNLKLNSINETDTLKISSLGYVSKEIIISKIDKEGSLKINLESFKEPLKEVIITSKKLKSYTDGKTKTNTSQQVIFANPEFPNINLGTEIGRKFKLEDDDPSRLTKFRFYIKDNNFDSVKFRINIYTLNENDQPDKRINIPNILVSAPENYTGWIDVDLSSYDLVFQENIIVAVEWIEHSESGNKLNLPIIIPSFGSTHYYKFGSQNSWEKYGGISSSMELTYKR